MGDFSSVGRADVEAKHSVVVGLVAHNLGVASALALSDCLVVGPFKGLELRVVSVDVFCAKLFLCLLFSETTSAILKGCKHSGWNIDVIH